MAPTARMAPMAIASLFCAALKAKLRMRAALCPRAACCRLRLKTYFLQPASFWEASGERRMVGNCPPHPRPVGIRAGHRLLVGDTPPVGGADCLRVHPAAWNMAARAGIKPCTKKLRRD